LLSLSRTETIHLIEERFDAAHKDVLNSDSLRREPLEQLAYLEMMYSELHDKINHAIGSYGIEGPGSPFAQVGKQHIELIKLRLKLACQHKPEIVFSLVESLVKGSKTGSITGSFYPIDDCLSIVQEHGQIKAAFLLNKKLGKYQEAIT